MLATSFEQSGRSAESREAAGEAVDMFEQKGVTIRLREARALAKAPCCS